VWDLRAPLADFHVTLPHDGKCVRFYKLDLKILPANNLGPKTCKIWCSFGWLHTWISMECIEISKIKKLIDRQQFLCIGQRSLVNFGLPTTQIWRWTLTHSNQVFWTAIFSPLEVLHHQIFACTTEWPRLASAHPTRDGVPPTIFFQWKLKVQKLV